MPSPSTSQRPVLTRDAIVAKAMALADAEGLDAHAASIRIRMASDGAGRQGAR